MVIAMKVTKMLLLLVLLALTIASTAHAQATTCNPYTQVCTDWTGPASLWKINGDVHLNGIDKRLGWINVDNLENSVQSIVVEFVFPDRDTFSVPILVGAKRRGSVGLHEYPWALYGYYSVIVHFQGRGTAYATVAEFCNVVNGQAECSNSHDIGGIVVP